MARVQGNDYEGEDRRAHRGNGLISEWAIAIARVGIPGAIAIYAAYMAGSELPRLRIQSELNYAAITALTDLVRQHDLHIVQQNRLLQQLCVNTAKDDNDRRNCFP